MTAEGRSGDLVGGGGKGVAESPLGELSVSWDNSSEGRGRSFLAFGQKGEAAHTFII